MGGMAASAKLFEMISAGHEVRHTRAEYIALERFSNVKHEFLGGEIYAMAGGSPRHSALAGNMITLLSLGLRGKPCVVHTSDLRVRIAEADLDTYPDVSVVCREMKLDPADEHAVLNPVLVVEVTSPSTEAYDRGKKIKCYQSLPSLREIVIVSHREPHIEMLRRENDGAWSRHEARAGEALGLAVGCELPVDEIYRDPMAEGTSG